MANVKVTEKGTPDKNYSIFLYSMCTTLYGIYFRADSERQAVTSTTGTPVTENNFHGKSRYSTKRALFTLLEVNSYLLHVKWGKAMCAGLRVSLKDVS